MATHWRWEKDKDGLVWLTFDKQGESANTFSKGAFSYSVPFARLFRLST